MIDEMNKDRELLSDYVIALSLGALIRIRFLPIGMGFRHNRLALKLGLSHGVYRNFIRNAYNVE